MSTVTASLVNSEPTLQHEGVTAVRSAITTSSSLSASSIVLLAKIPNHTYVLDGYVAGTSAAADGTTFKVGVVAESDLSAAITFSSTASSLKRFDAATLPVKVSLSDSANPQWTWLYLTHNAGTITKTHSLVCVVQYMPTGERG